MSPARREPAEVQRELGELSVHVETLERRLAEILAAADKEHEDLHSEIAAALAQLRKLNARLELHLDRDQRTRKLLAAAGAAVGSLLTAGALKAWDAWQALTHLKPPPGHP